MRLLAFLPMGFVRRAGFAGRSEGLEDPLAFRQFGERRFQALDVALAQGCRGFIDRLARRLGGFLRC